MNNYEKMISLMRGEAKKQVPKTMQKAIMTSSNTCKSGELKLDSEDLIFLEHIGELKKDDTVMLYRYDEDLYVILGKVKE